MYHSKAPEHAYSLLLMPLKKVCSVYGTLFQSKARLKSLIAKWRLSYQVFFTSLSFGLLHSEKKVTAAYHLFQIWKVFTLTATAVQKPVFGQ